MIYFEELRGLTIPRTKPPIIKYIVVTRAFWTMYFCNDYMASAVFVLVQFSNYQHHHKRDSFVLIFFNCAVVIIGCVFIVIAPFRLHPPKERGGFPQQVRGNIWIVWRMVFEKKAQPAKTFHGNLSLQSFLNIIVTKPDAWIACVESIFHLNVGANRRCIRNFPIQANSGIITSFPIQMVIRPSPSVATSVFRPRYIVDGEPTIGIVYWSLRGGRPQLSLFLCKNWFKLIFPVIVTKSWSPLSHYVWTRVDIFGESWVAFQARHTDRPHTCPRARN